MSDSAEPSMLSETFLRATIVWRTSDASDHWRFRLDPGGPFMFKAGQYATLGVATPQRLIERAYSIVSSPYEAHLEFFIELVPDGELTPLLHRLQTGDTLSLRRTAKGRLLFDMTSGRKNHLLLCTSTGVAPYVSYVRTLLTDWKMGQFAGDHHLSLVQGAQGTRSMVLAAEPVRRDEALSRAVGDSPTFQQH